MDRMRSPSIYSDRSEKGFEVRKNFKKIRISLIVSGILSEGNCAALDLNKHWRPLQNRPQFNKCNVQTSFLSLTFIRERVFKTMFCLNSVETY